MSDRWTVWECERGHISLVAAPMPTLRHYCFCGARFGEEEFDVVRAAAARTSDPDTSKLAALRQKPRSGSQRARILDAIHDHGPMTAREVGEVTGINGAWKRISELVQGGHLAVLDTRVDADTGSCVAVYSRTDRRPPEFFNAPVGRLF